MLEAVYFDSYKYVCACVGVYVCVQRWLHSSQYTRQTSSSVGTVAVFGWTPDEIGDLGLGTKTNTLNIRMLCTQGI